MNKSLSDLPAGWAWTSLGDVLPLSYGKGLTKGMRDNTGSVPVFGSSGFVGHHSGAFTSREALIVGRKGSVGEIYYSRCACWPIDTVYFVEGTPHTNLEFFYYLLKSLNLGRLDRSTAIPGLSRDDYNSLAVALPPLAEQRRIVAEIETQFTRLDAAVAALERARANLKRYRASALAATLSGEAFLDSSAVPRSDNNPMSIRMPTNWIWSTLAEISSLKGGITKGNRRRPGTVLQAVPYLRVANVQRGWLDLGEIKSIEATDDEIAALRLRSGDVLFNEGGDRDKLGRGWIWEGQIEECIHQNHVFRARLKPGTLLPKFLSHYANTFGQPYFMREGKQTTNLASINLTNLGAFPVPVPTMDEQVQIVDEVERQWSVCGEIEATISANLMRAERLRQSILRKAFAGQLVPQDPTDEPANALLDRIRAERAIQSLTRGSARKRLRPAQPLLL